MVFKNDVWSIYDVHSFSKLEQSQQAHSSTYHKIMQMTATGGATGIMRNIKIQKSTGSEESGAGEWKANKPETRHPDPDPDPGRGLADPE